MKTLLWMFLLNVNYLLLLANIVSGDML